MTRLPPWHLIGAACVGGALGGWTRWALGEAVPDGSGFPWTTFAINVIGSVLLGLLPALPWARRHTAAVFCGPGLLGGFTTLSATSEQGRALLASGRGGLAAAYLLGTLVVAVLAVQLASRTSSSGERAEFVAEEGVE
ncbi:MAG: CrcB family protein [Nocardioides sp.]